MNVLVIETAFLGDAILALALAEALRLAEPSVTITYLVRPESAELLKFAPAVDHVISYDKYGEESGLRAIEAKARQLNAMKFDVVFSLHESARTGMLLQQLQAPEKIGYGNFSSLTHRVSGVPGMQRSARAVAVAQKLYPLVDLTALPRLDLSSVALPLAVGDQARPIVAIAPGSVWSTKRWPPEYFADAAAQFAGRGYTPIFIGSPQDVEAMNEVRRMLGMEVIDLVGKTSISEAAAVIGSSRFLLANDSAPVHIATALRVPSIVIFGPTVRQFGFAPPPELGIVVEQPALWCRPCTSHGSNECPIHTHECMQTLPASAMFEVVRRFAEFNEA